MRKDCSRLDGWICFGIEGLETYDMYVVYNTEATDSYPRSFTFVAMREVSLSTTATPNSSRMRTNEPLC